jgi:hypothetical protein
MWNCLTIVHEGLRYEISQKSVLELFHAYRQVDGRTERQTNRETDSTKLTGVFAIQNEKANTNFI